MRTGRWCPKAHGWGNFYAHAVEVRTWMSLFLLGFVAQDAPSFSTSVRPTIADRSMAAPGAVVAAGGRRMRVIRRARRDVSITATRCGTAALVTVARCVL